MQCLELAGQRDDQDREERVGVRGVLEDHRWPDPGLFVASAQRDFDKSDIHRDHTALSQFGLEGGKHFVAERIPGSQLSRQV